MKKAVGYIRVSSEIQVGKGHSLEEQENRIRKYCEDNKLNLLKVYADKGITAREKVGRDSLNLMISELQPSTMIIFTNMDRLARNAKDQGEIFDLMIGKRCHCFYEMDSGKEIDLYSSIGRMEYQLRASINEFQSNLQSEKISKVMLDMAKKGTLRKKPPFGWKFVGKDKEFVEDVEEQKTLFRIRELILKHPSMSMSNYCRILQGEGWKCGKAKKWYSTRLKTIIRQMGEREKELEEKSSK